MRRALVLVTVVLLAACSSATPGVTPSPQTKASPSPRPLTGTIGGAQYRIEVPATWNGTLFLYSHG